MGIFGLCKLDPESALSFGDYLSRTIFTIR